MTAAGPGGHTTLKAVLTQGGPLDAARAVHIVGQIAAAVDETYRKRAPHREVTLATVLLSANGYAHLADATGPGSPEPAIDETAYRTDIRALAAVLYECLTGSPPNRPEGADAPPSRQRPGIPVGFDQVIARGLAENPDTCFRSAGELAAAAQTALASTPHYTPSNRPTSPDTATPDRDGPTQTIRLAPTAPPAGINHVAPQWHPRAAPFPPAPRSQTASKRPRYIAIAIAVVLTVGVVVSGAVVIPRLVGQTNTTTATAGPARQSSPPTRYTYTSQPVELPFPGLKVPQNVAADGAGNVYVLTSIPDPGDTGLSFSTVRQIFRLAPGAASASTLDVPGVDIRMAEDLAVDTVGKLYLSDHRNVWEWTVGSASPIRLPFRGFVTVDAVAVDPAGIVYAVGALSGTYDLRYGAKKLAPGDTRSTDLPFTDLYLPRGIAADKAGNVYIGDSVKGSAKGRVLKLAAGTATPAPLPFPELKEPSAVAVDTAGNLFVADTFTTGVFELPVGATNPVTVPVGVRARGVTFDPANNLYVVSATTQDESDHVTKPGQVLKVPPDR
ncbi:hypothetical protein [Mycobacterium angelicum]|uniref:Protein kinase domain-containing protein n=1 Tax=Mycobacterium angelicum TaxID=470074 RepID=A0A1X0A0Y2_MYCAN|nr:hypothetical protein [Mycobacterium angelicum]MCV7195481.1 hypothetical protein [Mycobacterium angelicum]ORA23767.1 hypothetical protein BST12_06265 [Mycobacterium angelicum]